MFTTWFDTQRETSHRWLHQLHRHPETGFEETRTAAFVAARLKDFGYHVATGIGGTGVVGTLHGGTASSDRPGRCIAFRAELDALPMQERAEIAYASRVAGRFHGCGHDGHMVTALTAAAYLAAHRDFDGTIRFIFQPAEELLTGARAMIADGLFERFPCDEVYALHNSPDLPAGQVGVPATAALSSADNIDITIHANGAHGSMPHTGEDAITAAAHFIASVQQTATRLVDARAAGVISFGLVEGGTARNILPETVRIEGTLRTTAPAVRDRLADLLQDAARATELLFGVVIALSVDKVAPVTLNHPTCVAAAVASASRVVGTARVTENARGLMASEDFSEFSARVKGAYFFIGQDGYAPHHPEFVFDPEIIPVGAAIFADLAKHRTRTPPRFPTTRLTPANIIQGRIQMITFTKTMLKGAAAATALIAGTAQMAGAEVLTLSSWVPPTHFVHTDFLVPFTEKVAEVTEGRVTVMILPAPLASPPQHWELARNGVADITWGNFTYEPERFVSLWFAEFPNAGTNAEAQSRALWQTYEAHLADNAVFDGVKMLAMGMFGGGQLHHGSRTVTAPEDVANVKFRMGGPIQERLLSSLGAVPVAAPATKAYEMLESGVIDGSLHTMESVVNFRLEDSLEHHTIFPNGFYDATFFVIMNGAKWDALGDEDRAAIEGIIGEELSAAWGRNFDLQNPAATEKLAAAGHEIVEASPELVAAVDAIRDTMVADWVAAAKAAGVADPQAMLSFYSDTYNALAAESAAPVSQ